MLSALALCFLTALVAPWLHARWSAVASRVLALAPLAAFAWFLTRIPVVVQDGMVVESLPWVPGLDVQLSFMLDGLSLLFALLITGLGALIVAYAGVYLAGNAYLGRFYLLILLFMGSMLGLVLADNLVALFVFWEMTSITSFLLIGFKHETEGARRSALQALFITAGGGLALLAGLVLLAIAGGSWELSALLAAGDTVREHVLYPSILVLVLIGALTKSAQFPFHFWLPNAMAAPTPVSAYLHSATMVKAGVFLIARMDPVMGGTAGWFWSLVTVGAATMLVGSVLAVRQTDMKRLLAYTTVAALGTLVMLLGLGAEAGIVAAMVFLVVHSLYKGTLFLVAGSIDYRTGSRDVGQLGGLRLAMPLTASAAILAGLSMAGIPPLFGFIGKELAYKAALGADVVPVLLSAMILGANVLVMVAAGLLVVRPFFGAVRGGDMPAEVPVAMWLGPMILASAGMLVGLFPGWMEQVLIGPAAAAVLGQTAHVHLALWYGFDIALLLSAVTMAGGLAAYAFRERLSGNLAMADRILIDWPERAYDRVLEGMLRLARLQTGWLQRDDLRFSLTMVLGGAVLLGGLAVIRAKITGWGFTSTGVYLHEVLLTGLVVTAAVAAVVSRSRIATVAALGGVGFGIAMLFLFMGAPDVAITQFMVETLLVVILLLVLKHLPPLAAAERTTVARRRRARNMVIAGGAGLMMAAMLMAVLQLPFSTYVSEFFANEAVPGGFGRNIVNVILVDFRALDTLGEIVVLAVAALGVLALIRMRGPHIRSNEVTP
jgi:multicomponent Na+:H+ antiporter subunit A